MVFRTRQAGSRIAALLADFPAVLVVGPRQCGKSTLVRRLLPGWRHVDLERPGDLAVLAADLEGFFDANPRQIVLDEAQRLPEIFPALRHVLDRSRTRGRFVLLGSASPALLRSAGETLAGRLAVVELTPFLASELAGRHAADRWFWGGYPPVHERRDGRARLEWLDAYVTTFLERDLPALGLSAATRRLRTLWTMLTHVHGQVLNISDLARSLAVSFHTVASDLDVLEGAFMIRRLQPYFANVQKRLTKSAKIYIRDTGLLHYLAGLRAPSELPTWSRRGASFEGLVIEELIAQASHQLVRPQFFFYRTHAGAEVDLLIADGRRILPIEVKLGAAVDHYGVAGLRQCMKDLGLPRGWVMTTGSASGRMSPSIEILPWSAVARGEVAFF